MKTTPYEEARDRLAALEQEYATIDDQIKRAGLSGDFAAVTLAMARKPVLPALLDQAQRALAPLEVAHYDAEIERVTQEAAPLYADIEAAQAEVRRAQAVLDQAGMALQQTNERVKALRTQRKFAWRRAQALEANPDGMPEQKSGKAVRSLWQAGSVT